MKNTTTISTWQRLVAGVVGGAAISFGVVAMIAPVANAEPKQQTEAQQECGSEDPDDVYTSNTDAGGNTFEKCCYKSGFIVELDHCDVWVNGKWNGDLSYMEQPPTPPPTKKPPVVKLPPGQVASVK